MVRIVVLGCLACAFACGRVGFDALGGASGGDGGGGGGTGDGGGSTGDGPGGDGGGGVDSAFATLPAGGEACASAVLT